MKKHIVSHGLFCTCLASLIVLMSGFGGYYIGKNASPAESVSAGEVVGDGVSEPLLKITVEPDSEAATNLSSEETGGNFNRNVQYRGVKNVTVEIDGQTCALEDALCKGLLSEEELFYLARADARNGFCEEIQESYHGLTHFTYCYPKYNLRIIYDIYETPDGQQHLISDLCVYAPKINLSSYVDFYDDETGYRLDREDWGIEVEITEVISTGMSLICTQSGGQQIGELRTTGYMLANEEGFVTGLDGSAHIPSYDAPLQMDETTQLTLDWADIYGELPSGEYRLGLHVIDEFDKSQVHPLMVDYHDWQIYELRFTIP